MNGLVIMEPWVDEAICPTTDVEIFHPNKGGNTGPAKLVCASCPVIEACLEYAVRTDQRYGIWGGKSERQRREIKRAQRRAA